MVPMISLTAFPGCVPEETPIVALRGTGDYVYDGYAPLREKPLRVYYHVPADVSPLAPVVIVLHGDERNADEYRDAWVDDADEYGFLVAAPEFTEQDFPGSTGYALGNVFEDGNHPDAEEENDPAVWSYSLIEPLWRDFASRTANVSVNYHVYGHSAGAQFAHRLVEFLPDGPYGYVLAANAGWYTVPDDAVTYPYGLGLTPLAGGPRGFFRRPLVILAGSADTDPDSAGLRHTPEADAQGPHRFARAMYFAEESERLADEAGAEFAWTLVVVEGVGHDHVAMGESAAAWLAGALGVEAR